MNTKSSKVLIGSVEWCAFPDLNVPAIKARVDSGAKTSSIHAFNIQPFFRDDVPWVSFEIHPLQKNQHTIIQCERPIVDQRKVKSSSGTAKSRYVVSVPLKLGDDVWDIEVTLANRDSMGFRMLLGREAMNGRLIIDPSLECVLGDLSTEQLTVYYEKFDV